MLRANISLSAAKVKASPAGVPASILATVPTKPVNRRKFVRRKIKIPVNVSKRSVTLTGILNNRIENYDERYCSRIGSRLLKSSGLLIKSSQPASIARR